MPFHSDHALHKRRLGRNLWLLFILSGFVALMFALSVVKISRGTHPGGFDHVARPNLTAPPGPEVSQ